MKTSNTIDLLCTAISGCLDTLNLIIGCPKRIEDGQFMYDNDDASIYSHGYTHVNSLLGTPTEMVRGLWDSLPESLQSKEGTKLVREFYPHLFKNEDKSYDCARMIDPARELHRIIYAIWQELHDAKTKFNLS